MNSLENLKIEIRSVLIAAGSRDITIHKLHKLYNDSIGDDIPYKEFNYTSLKEFLKSMPDVLYLKLNKFNDLCVYHIDTESTKHISDLKSKEIVKSKKPKQKSHQINQTNPISPSLLFDVLQKSKKLYTRKDGEIIVPKAYILDEISKQLEYTTYTIKDLNSQLYELSHLLKHDEGMIKFKNMYSENYYQRSLLQKSNISQREIHQHKNSQNGVEEIYNNTIQKTSSSSTSDLIKSTTLDRLINLIKKYPEGIWCSELPQIYQKEYGLPLEYRDIGFNSIVEFVGALPKIFQMVKPQNFQQWKVFDASISLKDIENDQCIFYNTEHKNCEDNSIIPLAIPETLYPKIANNLISKSVMNFNDTVDQIDVVSLSKNSGQMSVIISEVYNPSFFWIILAKNQERLTQFMIELHNFYSSQYLEKYKIPEFLLHPGLHVACTFADVWHRGIIKKVKPTGYTVLFYDYGTIATYKANRLYFLIKKFSVLPAQAIPCSLYNVKPIESSSWPITVIKDFSDKVMEKDFSTYIKEIDIENNSMTVDLTITTRKNNTTVHLNYWMVKKGYAEWGAIEFRKRNITFKHHQHVKMKNKFKSSDQKLEEDTQISKNKLVSNNQHDFIDHDMSSNSISHEKKILLVNRYKAKLSDSGQSSSSNCSSDIDPVEENVNFIINSGNKENISYTKVLDSDEANLQINKKVDEIKEESLSINISVNKIDKTEKDTTAATKTLLEVKINDKHLLNDSPVNRYSNNNNNNNNDLQHPKCIDYNITNIKNNDINITSISEKRRSKDSSISLSPIVRDSSTFNAKYNENNVRMFKSCDEVFNDKTIDENKSNSIIKINKLTDKKSRNNTLKELQYLIKNIKS